MKVSGVLISVFGFIVVVAQSPKFMSSNNNVIAQKHKHGYAHPGARAAVRENRFVICKQLLYFSRRCDA